MSEMTDADFVEHMHDLHLKCVAPSFDDGNRLMTIARRCVDATEVTARLIAERDALASDRDGYVQLLTDENNKLRAEVDNLKRMVIAQEKLLRSKDAEIEKLRADIAYADTHAAKVESLLWGTARENEKLRDVLSGVLWMADEWFNHGGDETAFSDDHAASLEAARAAITQEKRDE